MYFKNKLKNGIALILCFACICTMLSSCNFRFYNTNNTASDILNEKTFFERLSAIDGITHITALEQDTFAEKYLVTFEQPINWKNPDEGVFEQRVEIGYQGDSNINVYHVSGYFLYDKLIDGYLNADDRVELCKMYNANYINIEYRFFGDSIPEGLSTKSTEYWEHLTGENASADFHNIIEKLSKILTGKRIFTGESKGGRDTNTFACFYPDDADVFVPYVAPLCDGTDDDKFFDYIYNEIGNTLYSSEKAEEYRNLVLQFQLAALENREYLENMYWDYAVNEGCEFTEFCTKDILFDVAVLEFATQIWQYSPNFEDISNIISMPEKDDPDTDDDEAIMRLDAIGNYIIAMNDPSTWCSNNQYFSYYVQSAKEQGEHSLDFSYLRTALKEINKENLLAVTEDIEDGLLYRMIFTPEQLNQFSYSDSTRNKIIDWSKSTECNVIMIYGAADPWYAVRIEDTNNKHIHNFTLLSATHTASISSMDETQKAKTTDLLDGFLTEK